MRRFQYGWIHTIAADIVNLKGSRDIRLTPDDFIDLMKTHDHWSVAILPDLAGIEILIDDNGKIRKYAAKGDLEGLKKRIEIEANDIRERGMK